MAEPLTLSAARDKLTRARNALASVREEAKHVAKVGTSSLVVVGGGVAAGAISAKMPTLPGFSNVPTAAVAGSFLVALGMSNMLDEHSDNAALFGAGILAAIAARETEKALGAA
jgi:hypothetical protein